MSSGKFNKIVFQFERKNMMKIPENIQYVPHMANQYNSYRIPFQKQHLHHHQIALCSKYADANNGLRIRDARTKTEI